MGPASVEDAPRASHPRPRPRFGLGSVVGELVAVLLLLLDVVELSEIVELSEFVELSEVEGELLTALSHEGGPPQVHVDDSQSIFLGGCSSTTSSS